MAMRKHRSRGRPNAVFVWIPKSAGTSIYRALGKYGCQQILEVKSIRRCFPQRGIVTFGHIYYPELVRRGIVTTTFDSTAKKFAFVRNPYDRAVSLFFYLKRLKLVKEDSSFLQFCRKLVESGIPDIGLFNTDGLSQCNPQIRWVAGVRLDFLGRFEKVEEDFRRLLDVVNLPPVRLPRVNISSHEPYDRYYCEESRQIVADLYADDFLEFRYSTDLLKAHMRQTQRRDPGPYIQEPD